MNEFTAFDIIVLLVIGIGAFRGVTRGFLGEITSLGAWIAGIAAVRFFHGAAEPMAIRIAGSESGGAVLSVLGPFLIAFVAVRLIGGQLSDSSKQSTLIGPFDRILGLGFGATKGVLAAALGLLLIGLGLDLINGGKPPEWLAKSRTAPALAMVSRAMVNFVEDQRRTGRSGQGADPHAGLTGPGLPENGSSENGGQSGYDRRQRGALDQLLDEAEEKSPATPI
ncbi:CvpA family protein [Sandarakinorhabdus sp.]|uniref:CvpA family protein n=1 Tax=Sandarakinorhabdus sp. TaxID=1916663 RepID=UPI00286D97B7|nr:CvpA family protein [Sandarakinorhabdus sp.]